MLHEAVLLLGLYANGNPEHQHKLCWGPAPSLLQRLCAVPTQYLHTTAPCPWCMHSKHRSSSPCHDMHVVAATGGFREQCAQQVAAHADSNTHDCVDSSSTANNTCGTTAGNKMSGDPNLSPVEIRSPRDQERRSEDTDELVEKNPLAPRSVERKPASLPRISCPPNSLPQYQGSASIHAVHACVCGQAAAPSAPAYLQHVLYPTLLAACLDAPRNCQAVTDALGAQGILDYCTAHAPPLPPTASGCPHYTSTSSRTASVSPRTPASAPELQHAHSFSVSVGCFSPQAVPGPGDDVSAAVDRVRFPEAAVHEWHVDLGPLDGRFHPQHRIQATSWWRAHDQIMNASSGGFWGGSSFAQDAAASAPT